MQVIYKKQRPAEYRYELVNEFMRLEIAKKSFRKIITPQSFELDDLTLTTKKIGAGASSLFKKQYPPEHFIEEYLKIIHELWNETLDTKLDLTPDWVKKPTLKDNSKLHPDFKNKTEEELHSILSRKPFYKKENQRVVHGDLCPVNIIFDDAGCAIGLIDLGDLHVGNRMLDVAILSWTIRGNFGKKYESMFLEKIGITLDSEELEYYRLIYDLSLPNYKNWNWIKE